MPANNVRRRPESPPRANYKSMKDFLELTKRVTLSKVDIQTLRVNKIAPANERYLVAALRQMGLIDAEGTPTADMHHLQARGDEARGKLRSVFAETYRDLLDSVDLRSATLDDIKNFFILRQGVAPSTATKCASFFLGMARDVEVELSEALVQSAPGARPRRGGAHLRGTSSLRARATVLHPEPVSVRAEVPAPTVLAPHGPPTEPAAKWDPRSALLKRLIDTITVVELSPGVDKEAVEAAARRRGEDITLIQGLIAESDAQATGQSVEEDRTGQRGP